MNFCDMFLSALLPEGLSHIKHTKLSGNFTLTVNFCQLSFSLNSIRY